MQWRSALAALSILFAASASAILTAASAPVSAATLRYAFQGDVGTLDPHGLNETFTYGFLGNIYEGLTRRGPDLAIEPALAESWEMLEPTRWRFELRQGVTFHDGSKFDADDVLFSAERARHPASGFGARLAGVAEIIKVDDYTVDFVTEAPNPILPYEWDTWFIMDSDWAATHGAEAPTDVAQQAGSYAHTHANGTGPFMIESRAPDIKTEAVVNPNWWDTPSHNLERVVFQPIANDSTRVAALLSGEMDLVYPVPIQDIKRVDANPATGVMSGPELRTIFLGMDQARDALLGSDIEDRNPFQDQRVRQAVYQAIDIEAIQKKIMRGLSEPTAAMVAPDINGFPADLERYDYDPDAARQLLADAGYADGFSVTLDCPNDRYVNDEAICQAVVSMLAKIGIKTDLLAQTKSLFFAKVLGQGGYQTSFYLLGWTPNTFDSYNVFYNLVHSRNPETGAGTFNLGGYANTDIDALTAKILTETDQQQRNALIDEAWVILHDDVGYVPLHQQALAWGVRDGVEVTQRADNQFFWQWVTVSP